MGLLADLSGAEWMVVFLIAWFCLGVGAALGYLAVAHWAPHRLPPPRPTPAQHPRRRASDRPDGPPPQYVSGGRRCSDGPPMTRAEARRLREEGWNDEGPQRLSGGTRGS